MRRGLGREWVGRGLGRGWVGRGLGRGVRGDRTRKRGGWEEELEERWMGRG